MPRRRPRAMTLIELVLALAIASMVSLAAMGVVVNLSRSREVQRREADAVTARQQLEGLMEADLQHAERYRLTKAGIEFQSAALIDPETLETRHLDCTIAYQVIEIGLDSWLVRRQQSVGQDAFTELVCEGVIGIGLASRDDNGVSPDVASPRNARSDWAAVPRRLDLVVEMESAEQPRIELTLDTGW